ncbi:MAG: hypothetical protein ACI9MC_002339 [Kiritimatiellia bacterium]|jgi:uncharacterized protein (TIGR03382 family)
MHASHVAVAALFISSAALAADVSPRVPLRFEPITAEPDDTELWLKYRDAVGGRATDRGDTTFRVPVDRVALDNVIAQHGLRFEPLLDLPASKLRDLERRAAQLSGRAQPDLGGLMRVTLQHSSASRLQRAGEALQKLEVVEFVESAGALHEPPGDIAPPTPALDERQGYLGAEIGVDALYAWESWGLSGEGMRLSDCEYGWHTKHEDLMDADLYAEPDQTPQAIVASKGWDHHGTSVAGEVIGQDNGYGVTGISHNATFGMYPEYTNESGGRRPSAIAAAIADSARGDVVLLEMQATGYDGRYSPAEVNQVVWTVSRTGVDAGVIIVGAAGNGNANLDSTAYAPYRDRGHSGAILVGAGSSNAGHNKLSFSTYGDRVDVQGWGQNVFTTGYGSFANYGSDNLQKYTHSFSGTSSASPIVAGSVVLLIEASKRYRNTPLSAYEVRNLMIDTGSPQGSGAHIGPLPDLRAALEQLEADLDVLPSIVAISAPDSVDEGSVIELAVDVDLLEVHTPRIEWSTLDGTLLGEGATVSLDAVDDGVVDIEVTVWDEWERTDSDTVKVRVNNVAPTLTAIQVTGDPLEGQAITLSTELADVGVLDTHTWVWTVDGAALDSTPNSAQFTAADDGTYQVSVQVTDDDDGTSSQSIELVIDDVPATLTLTIPDTVERKEQLNASVSIDDPGHDQHTVRWTLTHEKEPTIEADGLQTSHAFKHKGEVLVDVVVTDEDGVQVATTATVQVVKRGGCGCDSTTTPTGSGLTIALLLLGSLRRRRRSSSESER